MKRKLKIIEKDMTKVRFNGRQVWGLCYFDKKKIEIEKTLKGKHFLEILSHEILHHIYPFLTERQVCRGSRIMTEALWRKGFRGKK